MPASTPGIRHVAFVVDDIDAVVGRKIEDYEDIERLCCVRGPERIIVELAERIG